MVAVFWGGVYLGGYFVGIVDVFTAGGGRLLQAFGAIGFAVWGMTSMYVVRGAFRILRRLFSDAFRFVCFPARIRVGGVFVRSRYGVVAGSGIMCNVSLMT